MRLVAKVFDKKGEEVIRREVHGQMHLSTTLDVLVEDLAEALDWLPIKGPDSWDRMEIEVHRRLN